MAKKKGGLQVGVPDWNPTMVLDRAPLPTDASIWNFQEGKAGYVANAIKQVLLLLGYMTNLRALRKHEMFLSLKRDLTMVISLMGLSWTLSPLLLLLLFFFFNNYTCSCQHLHFFFP